MKKDIEQTKMDVLLSLFKSWDIEVELKISPVKAPKSSAILPSVNASPNNHVAVESPTKPTKTMVSFTGILSEKDYQSLESHSEQARKEWNRAI